MIQSPRQGGPRGTSGTVTKVKARKKLIEVALPLEKINIASAREKSIRHGSDPGPPGHRNAGHGPR